MKRCLKAIVVLTVICTFVFIVTGGIFANDTYAAGDEPIIIPIPIDPESVNPHLSVVSTGEMPAYNAGSSATLPLSIKNNSSYTAKNVKITIEPQDSTNFPFIFNQLNLSKTVDSISGNTTKDIVFEFDIDPYAKEGIYTFKLNYSYANMYGNAYTSSEYIYIKITNQNTPPKLTVSSISINPETISPGNAVDLKFRVKNIGTLEAQDVKITLTGLRSDGFTVNKSTDVKYISSIGAGKDTYVAYSLIASNSIAGGNHILEVKMEYKDKKGNSFTEVNQVFLPVGKSTEGKPGIGITNIKYPEGTLSPEDTFIVSFDIVNNGDGKAENLKVTLSTDREIFPKSLSTIVIKSLDKGETKNVRFTLGIMKGTATKNYPIGINVEYDENQGNNVVKNSIVQYVGVYIENNESSGDDDEEEEGSKSVPKIIVDNYSFEPSDVAAGYDFNLKFSILNTSKQTDVQNIKVTVSSDDGTFTPVNSGNTFYIESIPAKGRVEKEIMLCPKFDAPQKSYPISINFEYEDSKGNQYTARETVSIPVLQSPRLMTGDIFLPPEAYVGQPLSISTEFYNMGKSTLYNLMVKAEGDFQVQGSPYFVGNFDPGRTDYFDTTIVPNSAGEVKGYIVFTFEDAAGKPSEIRKEFSINAVEMAFDMPTDVMPTDKMPEEMGGGKKFYENPIVLGVAGVVVVAAIVVITVILRRNKIRKELTFDE